MGAHEQVTWRKPVCPQHRRNRTDLQPESPWELANRFPGEQAAPGAGKESMGEGGSDTAAVEVDDASALAAREDDAPVEGVAAL